MKTFELTQHVVKYLQGTSKLSGDALKGVATLTQSVLDCLIFEQRQQVKAEPTKWQEQISLLIEDLVFSDLVAIDCIGLISDEHRGEKKILKYETRSCATSIVRGDKNNVITGSNITLHTDVSSSNADARVMDLMFGQDREVDILKSVEKKILFIAANPQGRDLRLDRDLREIEQQLKLSSYRERYAVKALWGATAKSIRQAILEEKPQILHFSGHSVPQGLILENEQDSEHYVDIQAIAKLFKLASQTIETVVLLSCYSAEQAKHISLYIEQVIAINGEIYDSAASAFCAGFYSALFAGQPAKQAVEWGQNAIALLGLKDSNLPILVRKSK